MTLREKLSSAFALRARLLLMGLCMIVKDTVVGVLLWGGLFLAIFLTMGFVWLAAQVVHPH